MANDNIVLFVNVTGYCFISTFHICYSLVLGKNIQNNNTNAVSESVRQNIQLLETDLMVFESNLVDELQTNAIFSEEQTKTMKLRNRSDQAHFFAETLEVMDDRNFLRVVDMLKRCSFKHIACSLQSSYEDLSGTQVLAITSHPKCPICRLRSEVDIKDLRCGLKREELLPYRLYIDINRCLAEKGQQDYLWKKLLGHLKYFEASLWKTNLLRCLTRQDTRDYTNALCKNSQLTLNVLVCLDFSLCLKYQTTVVKEFILVLSFL